MGTLVVEYCHFLKQHPRNRQQNVSEVVLTGMNVRMRRERGWKRGAAALQLLERTPAASLADGHHGRKADDCSRVKTTRRRVQPSFIGEETKRLIIAPLFPAGLAD